MVAVVFLVLQAPSSDADVAGSGTIDDPFTELDTSSNPVGESLIDLYKQMGTSTFYFERGAYVNIMPINPQTYTLDDWCWIDQDFEGGGGLVKEDTIVSGTNVGVLVGYIEGPVTFQTMGNVEVTYTFMIAEETQLEFLSDPTIDGILIPPNHHLIRFFDAAGSQIRYDIVEDGGRIGVPEGYGSALWSDSLDASTGLFDIDSPVFADICLYVFTGDTILVESTTLMIQQGSQQRIGVDAIDGVTWTAENSGPGVISILLDIDGIYVYALSAGEATVTISPSAGEPVTVDVIVSPSMPSTRYSVEIVENDWGAATADPVRASYGETVTLHVTPNQDRTLESIIVLDKDDGIVPIDSVDQYTYTFSMPRSNVYVHLTFVEPPPQHPTT